MKKNHGSHFINFSTKFEALQSLFCRFSNFSQPLNSPDRRAAARLLRSKSNKMQNFLFIHFKRKIVAAKNINV